MIKQYINLVTQTNIRLDIIPTNYLTGKKHSYIYLDKILACDFVALNRNLATVSKRVTEKKKNIASLKGIPGGKIVTKWLNDPVRAQCS